MNNLSGQNIKGYELHERIGAGGFGAVYRAFQSTVGREVAIKVILPGRANQPDFIRRFEGEAQLIARLEHHHIVPLYDYWRDPEGAYLVMRWLRGGSLLDLLQSHGALTIEEAVTMMDQLTQALHTAHRSHVIHRDIKPGNILLDEDGNAFLADFGIAKDHSLAASVTDADAIVGSPDYLSPEQARSEPVTPQTDVYSLGVVLYEMLEGQHPFPGLTPIERLYKHLNDPLPPLSRLDDSIRDEVDAVIQQATTKDPMKRFKDALALAQALREAAALDGGQATTSMVELLTPREQEVLRLIIDGHSNREIADELVLTVSTVKTYVNKIYKKLNVRSRVQAIVKARELDLIVNNGVHSALTSSITFMPEPENPYKGLRAFQVADEHEFFGREKLTNKLLTRLQEDIENRRFLAIVGPSGSGKSSVVRAGLIPALWRGEISGSDKWFIVDMLPGNRPLDELEVALLRISGDHSLNLREQLERNEHGLLRAANLILPDDKSELVLVIDQFEEVFTLVESEEQRQHFLNLLHTAVTEPRSRVRIVITLRADYYDRPLHYPQFGELMRTRVETVLPLGAGELERAIKKPAENVGVRFADGLISRIVADVNYQPGALPLLQYALTELFERRDNRNITLAAYEEIGGTGGALAKRADEIFLEYDEPSSEVIRQMFLRLVTLGEGAEDTRRRVERSELLSIAGDDRAELMDEIIDEYAVSRLLSLDHDPASRRPTVEVAHEAILREWDRLKQWLNESRHDIRQAHIVSQAADDWRANNRDASYLLRGSRLEQVESWLNTTELDLTARERAFIDASLADRAARHQADEERKAREVAQEKRSQRLMRTLVAVFAVAAILSGGFGVFALDQRDRAESARRVSERSEAQTENALRESERSEAEFRSIALALGAQDALNDGLPDVALALALEAINMDTPPPAAHETLINTSSSTWIQRRFVASDISVIDAVYHPDGKRILTSSWDGRVIVWDIESGEKLQTLNGEGLMERITIHPDGNMVAVGSIDGIMWIWDMETGDVIAKLPADYGLHRGALFSSDGAILVTTSNFGTVNVWDTETFSLVRSFVAHVDAAITSTQFSPDESMLITAANDGTVKIWDFETAELLQMRQLETTSRRAVFLGDGERVLVARDGGEVFLWDWRADDIIWSVPQEDAVQDVALSPDEQIFVMGLNDPVSEVQLRYVETGKLIRVYKGHTLRVQNVDFSSDGRTILGASNDGTAIIWHVNWGQEIMSVPVNSNNTVVWHPTEDFVATVGIASNEINDTTIRFVDTKTGEVLQEFEGHEGSVRALMFSADGTLLYSGSGEGVFEWDIESGELVRKFTTADENGFFDNGIIFDIAIHEDKLAASDSDGNVLMWDMTTGDLTRWTEQVGQFDGVPALTFSPDGEFLYSAGRDGTLTKLDASTGEIAWKVDAHDDGIWWLTLSSDGTRLLTASVDRTASVWDAQTGALIRTLRGHLNGVDIAEFSPDESLIMTASKDGAVILWDAQTGEPAHILVANSAPFQIRATFSPDGSQVVSAANDILTFWDVSELPDDFVTWVKDNRHVPDFTCEQRDLYQIEPLCD